MTRIIEADAETSVIKGAEGVQIEAIQLDIGRRKRKAVIQLDLTEDLVLSDQDPTPHLLVKAPRYR